MQLFNSSVYCNCILVSQQSNDKCQKIANNKLNMFENFCEKQN